MKKLIATTLLAGLLGFSAANAGTVMNMVDKDAAGAVTAQIVISADGGKVRMDQQDDATSIIFQGDSMIVLDHNEQKYLVMDDAMLDQLQIAMQQMQAQLAAMPPEQRAMVEQMMQGSMPGGGAQPEAPRLESLGSDSWGDYSCTRYAVFEGDDKTQEICAAPLDDIPGGEDVMGALQGMVGYMDRIIEAMPPQIGNIIGDNPLGYMAEIEGFPVQGLTFEGGQMTEESTLESVTEASLDPAIFSPPANYQAQDMGL